MIILTGGAGFIGSVTLKFLNNAGYDEIIVVDNLYDELNPNSESNWKYKNLVGKRFTDFVNKNSFLAQLSKFAKPLAIIHLGACSDTTVKDANYAFKNNFSYSKTLAEHALKCGARFIYASSAAVYGGGEHGFGDTQDNFFNLKPLNLYGYSKLLFDQWIKIKAVDQKVCGLRFFNVYGPNEYHKGKMISVVNKAYNELKTTGKISLFKSYNKDFKDGEQKRDFIFVDDCAKVITNLIDLKNINGVFNLGSGEARSWNDLANSVIKASGLKGSIKYVEMPNDLREQYQYFTEADLTNLRSTGFKGEFSALETGIEEYVKSYLMHTGDNIYS